MYDLFALLVLAALALFVLSLLKPDWALFFAVPGKKTRVNGMAFWSLACLDFFVLFLAISGMSTLLVLALGFGLTIALCVAAGRLKKED
jgi:hypothetical protein